MYVMTREGAIDYKPLYGYLCRISVYVILFYGNYLFLIDKFLFKKQFIKYIAINLVCVALLIFLQSICMDIIMNMHIGNIQPPRFQRPEGPHGPPLALRLLMDYVTIFLVIGLSVAVKMTIRWYRDSINTEKEKSVQLEADLRNLRSQLNPHFLFNTLNNIYSLIAIDTSRAQEAVHRLSNLLRYVMYENNEKFVPLDREIIFTKNYIDLMSLRLSPKVKLIVDIPNTGSQDIIASLMFITLIENAFKHGIANGSESFIDISILVDPGKGVLCTVENSLFEKDNIMEKRTGIGLVNLSKRLELLYPDKHEFITEKRIGSFFTLLRINF